MRKIFSSKKLAALAVAAVAVTGTGVAYAYWTTSGSGGGSATAAASNGTLILSSDAVPSIAPGESKTFDIYAKNLGVTDLRVNQVTTVVSSTVPGCQTLIGDFSVAPVNTSASNVAGQAAPVALADAGTVSAVKIGTGTLVYANDNDTNQDACKSAPLALTFSATSTSGTANP